MKFENFKDFSAKSGPIDSFHYIKPYTYLRNDITPSMRLELKYRTSYLCYFILYVCVGQSDNSET